jgi:hypothetical protein
MPNRNAPFYLFIAHPSENLSKNFTLLEKNFDVIGSMACQHRPKKPPPNLWLN